MTTIRELIQTLQQHADEHGEDCEVRLAQQPNWPFEYSIGEVVAVSLDEYAEEREAIRAEMRDPRNLAAGDRAALEERLSDITDDEPAPVVVYLAEGHQLGYLPGAAQSGLGWGR